MNSQLLGRIGQRKPSDTASSNRWITHPKRAARFQFEHSESIAEEVPQPIQQNTQLNVREIHKSRSNLSSTSRQRLVEPEQFSSQNPWFQSLSSHVHEPQVGDPSRKLRKSASVVSLATVKKLLKKNHTQLPRHPIDVPDHHTEQYIDPRVFSHLQNPQTVSIPRDFASSFTPNDIVLHPQRKHARLSIVTKPESPMARGGGILRGKVAVSIAAGTGMREHLLDIGYLSVDLLGIEHCGKRHHVFQSLAVDLIDTQHSPPAQFTASSIPSADGYWQLAPSTFSLPFELQLPKTPGPPPFRSRHGSIQYIVSTTAIVRVGSRETFVRDTCKVCILGTHNPRTSLANLPLPLNAVETLIVSRDIPYQDITLKTSLNRDVWTSGMSVFVDVHVINKSWRTINKVTLSLERVMMVYHHSIAQLDQGLYRQSRLPDKTHRKTVARNAIAKSETGWRGISPHSRESRTWMLNLPTGLATISTGRFFGVRYFLNISLHLAFGVRTLEARLPVTILDPNSLDIISGPKIRLSKESHQRSSIRDSELPLATLRRLKRVEQRTPRQDQSSRKRRETWAWVSELSPHPSLVPSPLLPSYTVPTKTDKTSSRLHVGSRLSTPAVPHIPERLRPPLEEEESETLNRRHQIATSENPRNALDAVKAVTSTNHEPTIPRPIGTSTLNSFRERLQHRAHGAFIGAGLQEPSPFQAGQVADPHTTENAGTQIRNILQDINTANISHPNKSPFQRRKPLPHRRAISRSKDVRSIYRVNNNSPNKKKNMEERNVPNPGENAWETVENFF